MVDELGNSYSDIAKSHRFWIISSGIVLIATSILGCMIGPDLPNSLLQNLLFTLITAVASVLAITFSVLFISTQIASERYSPKFTVSFVNDPIVQMSFGLGIFSITSNLSILTVSTSLFHLLVSNPNGPMTAILWIIGGFLVGLNIVFFLLLYPIIRLILLQTTPDNMLSQFERQYNATKFQHEAKNAEKITEHPMQPVYDFSRNAMKREDYNTAISAVGTLYGVPSNLLPQLVESEDIDIESVFGPVLEEYGRSLINQANESNFPDVVATASEGMVQLGTKAIDEGEKEIYDAVFSTSYSLFQDRQGLSYETNVEIVNCCSKLYSSAAKDPDILKEYIPRQAQLVSEIPEIESMSQLEKCVKEAKNAHNRLVSSNTVHDFNTRPEEVLLGNKGKRAYWEKPEDDPTLLMDCTFLMMQTSGEILSLCEDSNPPGFLYESWESAIQESNSQGLESHVEHLVRRYIELAVFIDIDDGSGLSAPNRISGIITDETKSAALSSCDSILSEERSISEMNENRFLELSLTEIWAPVPLVEYSDEFLSNVQEVEARIREL